MKSFEFPFLVWLSSVSCAEPPQDPPPPPQQAPAPYGDVSSLIKLIKANIWTPCLPLQYKGTFLLSNLCAEAPSFCGLLQAREVCSPKI